MSRVSVTINKPVNDRKTLMARSIVVMLLLSTLLQISVHIGNHSADSDAEVILEPEPPSMAGTSPTIDVDNLELGGRHLITNEWWEGKLDSIPDSNDQDGDGIVDSQDNHPWDRNRGDNTLPCARGCSEAPDINVEKITHEPDFTDDHQSTSLSELGDLDKDGDLDIVMLSPYYLYFVPNELGVFGDPIKIDTNSYQAKDMKLADLDGDGDLDVILSTNSGKSISFVELNGISKISSGAILSHDSSNPNEIYFDIGDANGDGLVDILSGSYYGAGDSARLFTNTYDAINGISFNEEWSKASSGTSGTKAIAFNDYDNDGDDDIFLSRKEGSNIEIEGYNVDYNRATIVNSTADYNFDPIGSYITAMVSGDLNHDGYNELVMSDAGGDIYVLWNRYSKTGIGEYGSEEYGNYSKIHDSDGSTTYSKNALGLADFGNDGLLDIYSGSAGGSVDVAILTAVKLDSSGALMDYKVAWKTSVGATARLSVGDIDANGLVDVLINPYQSPIYYHRLGGGILDTAVSRSFDVHTGANYAVGVGLSVDYDSDGDQDLLLAGQQNISAYENDGGLSTDPVFYVDQYYATSLSSADINNDGYPDLVTAGYTDELSLFWGSENGFNYSSDLTIDPENKRYGHTSIVDINGDGKLDIIFDSYKSGTINHATERGYVYTYDGDGGFDEYWKSLARNSSTNTIRNIILTDSNGDGITDYVRCLGSKVHIYNGTSSGSGDGYSTNFSAQPDVLSISSTNDCEIYDFNQDGYSDLITSMGNNWKVYNGPLSSTTTSNDDYYSQHGENGFSLADLNLDGRLDLMMTTYGSKKAKIVSYDGQDFNEIWEGGNYRLTKEMILSDFDDDGVRDLILLNWQSAPELILGDSDIDGDGISDDDDDYPYNPTQHSDEDNDGYGDEANGYLGDNCVYYWGDSTEDRRGCPDQDGDGWSDLNDDFWRDGNQWNDTDNDGYGDNYPAASVGSRKAHWPGEQCPRSDIACNFDQSPLDWDDDGYEDGNLLDSITPYDSCPFEVGTSWDNNKYGCLDSDLDGWANVDDVYPTQNSQHSDSDGDGFGDNASGWLGDYCPNTSGQSVIDYYGCVDSDNDGWSVLTDLDDNDPFEQEDSDNDTIGDNGDRCPYQWSNLTIGPDRGCPDTDADNRADRSDAFPYDPTQWRDVDNDGYGDNQSGNNADAFPQDGTQWSDSDGDGKGDNANGNNADAFPSDRTQWQDNDGDGYGDNVTGNNSDVFPQDGTQWSDIDGDGKGDNINGNDADLFPYDSSQWSDKDGDGYGDNPSGNTSDKCSSDAGSSSYRINNDGIVMEWFGCPDSDNDQVPDDFDDCSNTAGSSYIDQISCPDSDNDAVSDMNDPYPYSFSAGASNGDWDNDSFTDKRPQFMLNGPDVFPNDSTQWNDSDEDGFGDNLEGNNGDWCINSPPFAIVDERGCAASELDDDGDGITNDIDDCLETPTGDNIEESGCSDSDEDGVADFEDAFPEDSSQWSDQDDDGYGDEPQGLNADDCISDYGTSWIDSLGCEDSDGDGYSDDGDDCDNLPGWSYIGSLGCPDSDGDGVSDIEDAFPDDNGETIDSDGDGIGDSADFCFRVDSNESIDCTLDQDNDGFNDSTDIFPSDETEWMDTDGDGTGDNADIWPTQSEIWSDVDGDGFADQYGHPLTDDCPSINGTSTKFMQGCSDMDFDGMPDLLDPDADGDGITNDNEMDASTQDIEYDPFNSSSTPPDMDLDGIPDKLDKDADGDGFPNELEKERGSDQYDENMTPFTLYGEQETGLFYVPGEGFKSQYDPNGIEFSVSALIDILTGEFLIPILMIPITIFALLRKGRRYKRMRRTLEGCNDIDILNEYEEGIDNVIMKKKIKVEHGMLLRNLFERKREELDTKKSVTGMKRNSSGNSNNDQGRRSMGRGVPGGMQGGGMGNERSQGPQRPSPGRQRPDGGQGGRNW